MAISILSYNIINKSILKSKHKMLNIQNSETINGTSVSAMTNKGLNLQYYL